MGFRNEEGLKRYVRSKRLNADRAISWAWASVAGTSKSKLAFVPYSTNDRQQSRWGGMDFDAHQGEADRARQLAFAAFRVLLNTSPDLCVIVETSGSGGWHVWAISAEFHDTREWVRFFKQVASRIGAPIVGGLCEIFPPDSLPARFGKGMRAPGCWNPATDTLSEIIWENTHTSLGPVLSGKSKGQSLIFKDLQDRFPDTEKETSFSSSPSPLIPYHSSAFLQRFAITVLSTRNLKLAQLVGQLFYQVGHTTARTLAEAQYRAKTVPTNASEGEHLASFEKLWVGLTERWAAELTETEREALARLETENERDGFRIIRGYARKAEQDGLMDFPIGRDNLGERLGITGKGAAGIREKLVRLGVIQRTADYVPNKFAARFKWCLKTRLS
jgi:hypothetical protein